MAVLFFIFYFSFFLFFSIIKFCSLPESLPPFDEVAACLCFTSLFASGLLSVVALLFLAAAAGVVSFFPVTLTTEVVLFAWRIVDPLALTPHDDGHYTFKISILNSY